MILKSFDDLIAQVKQFPEPKCAIVAVAGDADVILVPNIQVGNIL